MKWGYFKDILHFSVGMDLSNAPDSEKTDRESTKQHKKFGKELAKVQKDKEKKKVRKSEW